MVLRYYTLPSVNAWVNFRRFFGIIICLVYLLFFLLYFFSLFCNLRNLMPRSHEKGGVASRWYLVLHPTLGERLGAIFDVFLALWLLP